MSLYFDNFGGSGKPAWTTNTPTARRPANPYGQAQPIQPQSQGTPYGGPNGSWVGGGNQLSKNGYGEWTMAPQANFGNDAQNTQPQGAQPKSPAVRPGDPRTGDPSLPPPTTGGKLPPARQQPFSAWNQTPNPFGQQFGGTFTPGGGAGNMAYAPPDERPQPFTQNTTFGGQQFGNMGDAFAMRDAFVQSVNQAKAPFAQQWGSGNPTAPNLDFDALMRQAGDAVQGGWANPFAPGQARPVQPQSQGTPYGALGNIGTSLETHGTIGLGSPAQPPGVHRHSPNDTLQYAPGPYWPGTYQPIAWGPDRRMGTADDQPPARPSQAQPVPPPSQGTPYGSPAQPSGGPGGGGYYNSAGEPFTGTMSFAPGTSAQYRREAMQQWAASQGFYPRGQGQAQPVQPPSQGTPYYQPPSRLPVSQSPSIPAATQSVMQGAAPTFGVFAPGSLAPQPTPATREGVDASGIYMDPKFRAEKEANEARAKVVEQNKVAEWQKAAPQWQKLGNLVAQAEAYSGKPVKNSQGIWAKTPYDEAINKLTYGPNAIPGADQWYSHRLGLKMQGGGKGKLPATPTNWSELNQWITKPERDRELQLKLYDMAQKYAPPPTAAQLAKQNQARQAGDHAEWMLDTAGWQKSASPVLKWNR